MEQKPMLNTRLELKDSGPVPIDLESDIPSIGKPDDLELVKKYQDSAKLRASHMSLVGHENIQYEQPYVPSAKALDLDISTAPSGATRSTSADLYAYHLIHPIGLRRLAQTYREGEIKYSPMNCEQGFPSSQLFNHVINHIFAYLAGDRSEDHAAHAVWGLFQHMMNEELHPELLDGLRGPNCSLTEAIKTDIRNRLEHKQAFPEEIKQNLADFFAAKAKQDAEIQATRKYIY